MPIQYDPPTLHGIHPIDAEWDKANANLACNLSSDALDNTIFLDLQQPSEFQDPTYDPLSQGEQEKLHAQYSKIPVTKRRNIKKLIVIGIPHGGTTWFATKVLNKHQSIHMHGELLFGWSTSYCNAHVLFNDNVRCNWNTLKSIMETFYTQQMVRRSRYISDKERYYIGFKITLWQMTPTMYGDFVRWIYCNDVTVIQLVRSASINSFYSQQAQVFENLFYGREFFKTQADQKHVMPKNEAFDLDPIYVKKFVTSTEYWQKILFQLLKFHRKSIHFLVLYYEDLLSEHAADYLNSVQAFLQVSYDENVFTNARYGIARLHSTPCHLKIKNWDDAVKYNLIGTDSYYACEKDNS